MRVMRYVFCVLCASALSMLGCESPLPADALHQMNVEVASARGTASARAAAAARRGAMEASAQHVEGARRAARAGAIRWDREVWEELSAVERHNHRLLRDLFDDLPETDVRWRHIVIHHTAVSTGTVERISRFHARKFEDPDGIQYHFVVGNGRGIPRGQIAPGRWPLQKRAIHLFKPERAPSAIAISLVGNYEVSEVPDPVYEATLALVQRLSATYNIPPERVTTHRRVDGRLTQCPGKNFPYDRLIKDLSPRK